MTIDMKALIEEHITSSEHLAKKHVHPRLMKMFQLGGMSNVFTRAEGQYLYTEKGEKFLDLLAGGGVHFIGRNHPVVNKALADVIALDVPNLCVVNASILGGLLAGKLAGLAGGNIGKVQFANSGSEATEVAVRFARFVTRRRRFIYLEGAFHGRSYGAISLCGFRQLRDGMDPLMPTCTPVRVNDIETLRRELAREDVAGLIFEPVQGMTCDVADAAWLREAEALCRKHGTILIADEVQTGLGRLGAWFASTDMGIRPDMITVSKTLSGGHVPVSAVLVSDDVYQRVFQKFTAGPIYFSTFAENNLAMAAGLATIDVLEEMDAPRRSRELSQKFRAGLADIASRYDCIERIAGRGLMISIYFRESDKKRLKIQQAVAGAFDPGAFGASVNVEMYKAQRVIVQIPGPELNAIKILPPVICTDADVNWFLNSFEDTLASYYGRNSPVLSLGRGVVSDAVNTIKGILPGAPAPAAVTVGRVQGVEEKKTENPGSATA